MLRGRWLLGEGFILDLSTATFEEIQLSFCPPTLISDLVNSSLLFGIIQEIYLVFEGR